uniref:Uncharacterized protein n=1 Tax=Anopheles culicifacies TaxID=139723 RepID=A0A182MDP2_9DIPT
MVRSVCRMDTVLNLARDCTVGPINVLLLLKRGCNCWIDGAGLLIVRREVAILRAWTGRSGRWERCYRLPVRSLYLRFGPIATFICNEASDDYRAIRLHITVRTTDGTVVKLFLIAELYVAALWILDFISKRRKLSSSCRLSALGQTDLPATFG